MTNECRVNDQDVRSEIVNTIMIIFNLHANGFRDNSPNDRRRSITGLAKAIEEQEIPLFHLNLMVQTGARRAKCQHPDPVQLFEEIMGRKLNELAKK